MKRRYWTAEDEALMRQHYADTRTDELARTLGRTARQVLAKAAAMGLHKSRELIAQQARENTSAPGHASQRTRFRPGLQPWNKGKTWTSGGRSDETRFRPGHKPHTWVPVGSYRVVNNKNGGPELQQKVNDDPGPSSVRWKAVARLVWEAAHGSVPDGRIVVFKIGQRTTELQQITLDRLECITRVELMRRNSYHTNNDPELRRLIQLRGALNRIINRKTKEAEEA